MSIRGGCKNCCSSQKRELYVLTFWKQKKKCLTIHVYCYIIYNRITNLDIHQQINEENVIWGLGEIALFLKDLTYKHEDSSSLPRTHKKKKI